MHKLKITWLVLAAFIFFETGAASAQEAKTFFDEHQYSKAIQALLAKSADLSGLSNGEMVQLGGAYMRRGYMLRDLAALQIRVGRDYYFDRDTSKAAKRFALTPYFLGRYLYESGEYAPALKALQRAGRGLTGADAERCQIWIGACQQQSGKTAEANAAWSKVSAGLAGELAYARAAAGLKSEGKCGSGSSLADLRCRLWAAAQQNISLPELNKLQTALLNSTAADAEQKFEQNYIQKFYDPATPQILAHADFAAAAEVFSRYKAAKGREPANYYAGVSAYEAGDDTRARTFLQQTNLPQKDIYLGAIAFRSGQRAEAGQKWQAFPGANEAIALEWAEVTSRLVKNAEPILALHQKHLNAASAKMELALPLGRALAQVQRYEEALEVMQAAYPESRKDQMRYIEPAFLLTLAQVKYDLWARQYFIEILGHIACLREAYPVTLGVLDIAQGIFTPRIKEGKKIR